MLSIPREIVGLIVDDLRMLEYYGSQSTTLSSLCLACPDAVPFIRQYRFDDINVSFGVFTYDMPLQLTRLISIIDSAPEVASFIRRIEFSCYIPAPPDITPVIRLVTSAVNLQHLRLTCSRNDDQSWALARSLPKCSNLRTLYLRGFFFKRLSDLFRILHSNPCLTTLDLQELKIEEFIDLARVMWPEAKEPVYHDDNRVACTPWDASGYDSPKPALQVSSLRLDVGSLSDLLLLDLISSHQMPFPNLQTFSLKDYEIDSYRPQRLAALLETYKMSVLRVLHLGSTVISESVDEPVEQHLSILTLPASVEEFKFTIGVYLSVDPFWHAISSNKGSLKYVAMRIEIVEDRGLQLPPGFRRFDEVLAGMDRLERLDIYVHFSEDGGEGLMQAHFPNCMKRYEEGTLAGGIEENYVTWFMGSDKIRVKRNDY